MLCIMCFLCFFFFFFFNDTATTEIYTLSLHDALPISIAERAKFSAVLAFIVLWFTFSYAPIAHMVWFWMRSEEHTSELQSPCNLVCRLLLEKKKKSTIQLTLLTLHTLLLHPSHRQTPL